MRTHLIMNSHRLATFQDIKTEVTNVKQAQSAVMARSEAGDELAETGCRRRVIELPNVARSRRTTTVGSRKERRQQREEQQERVSSKTNATSVA